MLLVSKGVFGIKEFSKEIKLSDNKDVRYDICNGNIPIHVISAHEYKDYHRILKFNRWDDYSFSSWFDISYEDEEKINSELHVFEKNHPLYIPLLHLLNGEEELIIDDDETCENNKKYMRIFHSENNISIEFINNLDNDSSLNRFSVFIKNIVFDLRSKIDCLDKDTKYRLYFFFLEVLNLFEEEHHQMTIEEYLINNDQLSLEESKKYVKKFENKNYY